MLPNKDVKTTLLASSEIRNNKRRIALKKNNIKQQKRLLANERPSSVAEQHVVMLGLSTRSVD